MVDTWDKTENYRTGRRVKYGKYIFACIQANIGIEPLNIYFWRCFTKVPILVGPWMEDEIYLINQVVSRDTKLYRCVLPNINEPLEDNLHYWIPVYDPLPPLLSLLEAKVGYFTCPDSTGIHQVTGLGFKPQRVQFFVTKGPGLQNHFCCCHGMMDENGNQNCLTWAGVWSNIFKGDSKRDLVIYTINSSGNSQVTASFVSMDDDGFTLDFSVVNTAFDIQWTAD